MPKKGPISSFYRDEEQGDGGRQRACREDDVSSVSSKGSDGASSPIPTHTHKEKRKGKRYMNFDNIFKPTSQKGRNIAKWERSINRAFNMQINYQTCASLTRVESCGMDGRHKFVANQSIPKGTCVGVYKGDVYHENDPRRNRNYSMQPHRQDIGNGMSAYTIDTSAWLHKKKCNLAYINHSCENGNIEIENYQLRTKINAKTSISAYFLIGIALRDINKNEELLYNYDGEYDADGENYFDTWHKTIAKHRANEQQYPGEVKMCKCNNGDCPNKFYFIEYDPPVRDEAELQGSSDDDDYNDDDDETTLYQDGGKSNREASSEARRKRMRDRGNY
jgi:hypothetical protein